MTFAAKTNVNDVKRAFKTFDKAALKDMRKELRDLSKEITSKAKSNAGWSRKIPPAIVPSVTQSGGAIRVRASVPIAVLNERGKPWRHPLFGNRNSFWPQPARRFVKPVVDASLPEIQRRTDHAIAQAAKRSGL
jgi:hypothetical protein